MIRCWRNRDTINRKGQLMKFHITVEETTRTVYEVDASTEHEARQKFTDDGGKFVGSETDLQTITEIEVAEDA